MKKLFAFLVLAFVSFLSTSLFASPTSDFSLDSTLSNLIQRSGIFYTRTGSLSLSGTVSSNVQMIEFSGATLTGGIIYQTGGTLTQINSFFSLSTPLTDGTYSISGLDGSGTVLGSETLVIDTVVPQAQSITYLDDNHNGKIDKLAIVFDETMTGVLNLPYSTGMTVSTRKWGLLSSGSTTNIDFSDHITSASFSGNTLILGFQEGDMIKNTLSINTNAGASASDLKFRLYTNATAMDIVGNITSLAVSKFPNSSTGIIKGTTSIDYLDTGFLNGAYFSGALSVNKIDSRNLTGSLILSGVTLSLSADSFLGDGNILKIGSGSKVQGSMILLLGSGSSIQNGSGNTIYSNTGYNPYFTTLSGALIASGATMTESGMVFNESGLVGSGLSLEVSYETASGTESVYSGSLTGTSTILSFSHAFSSGSFRTKVFKIGDTNDILFPGIKILFYDRVLARMDISAGIVLSGSIVNITDSGATLSGITLNPLNGSGVMYYGTGILSQSGVIQNGNFSFSGLVGNAIYLYRLGFTPFPLWNEIYSATGSFQTLKTAPDIVFAFQQWSYVTASDTTLSDYTCDTTHADCKINFDLTSSFTGGFVESDYNCSSNFSGVGLTETGKCNPSSVTFPRGQDYTIRFQITRKSDSTKFSERTIVLHSPNIPVVTSSYGGGMVYIAPTIPSSPISIAEPSIRIQSGLDVNNRCLKSDCTLNLEYKVLGPKEVCHWDFSGGSYSSGTTNKCNPGYIHYPFGEFTVTLRVFEQGNISNYREKVLHFSNGTPMEIREAITSPTNHVPVPIIKLQGTLGKTKIEQGKSVQCIGVDECNINLSGEESYDLDHDTLSYSWNFGNGMMSDKENPLAVKYGVGKYSVILRITDSKGFSSEDVFRVSVLGKDQKEVVSLKPLDPNVFSLKLTGVSPNPLGNDGISEWVEITNPLGLDISLAGCTLDDAPEKGSNPYVFQDSVLIRANSSKRYYKLQTSLNFNNTGDSVNLSCGAKFVSMLTWDYSVPEGFIVSGKEGPYSGKVRTKVLRVIDGDTIQVELYGKQEKVRLIGVDTPETVDPRKAVQYYGKEASNYVGSQLEGQEVELEFDFNPRDKYDRLLAYIWLNGKNFNSELIQLGYARAYLRFPFRYFKEFEKLGKETIKNKVGLWADAEVKKLLDADAKEDKKALEKQLQEEDVAILDDLIEVVEETKIGFEKLDVELFDSLFVFDDEENPNTLKYSKVREAVKDMGIEDIHISLQGSLSKNRILSGNRFICQTKTTCSVNFIAGKTRKNTIYLWDFGNEDIFYGANPLSRTFPIGKHNVTLKIFDTKTMSIREESFSVVVEKLVSVKKEKSAKIIPVKTEKPLSVKGQDFIIPPPVHSLELSPFQASTAAGLIVLVFFGGAHVIVRKKGIIPN